jgi:hypothetical protein
VADLSSLTATTTPALTDLLYAVIDPGGTPLPRKVTIQDIVNLASRNVELGTATSTTLSQALTTTPVDLTGLTKTVTVGSRPILVSAIVPVSSVGAAGRTRILILEDGGTVQIGDSAALTASGQTGTLECSVRLAPAAGSHTYKLQGATVTAASGALTSGATFPAQIVITEL